MVCRDFIAESPLLLNLLRMITEVARTEVAVLFRGERGTGKELLAEQVHAQSGYRDAPFVRIKCAEQGGGPLSGGGLPGRGTLFLDEVSALDAARQEELLALLADKARRVVASTSADLEVLVEAGAFSRGLFNRLNVMPLTVPPLREHKEDVAPLAAYFLKRYCREMNRPLDGISPTALEMLEAHYWPGNARELKNVMEHAVMLCKGTSIQSADIPLPAKQDAVAEEVIVGTDRTLRTALHTFKRQYVIKVLESTGWNKAAAARILKVQRTYIFRIINELNIR